MSNPSSKRPIHTLSGLARRFKEVRREAGMSCVELARLTGVSRNTIHRIETGEDCSASTLLRLLMAMKFTLQITPTRRPTLEEARSWYADDDDEDQ